MNVLWVFAHPEPRSLNGALRDEGIGELRASGHQVRESDLYAMGWDPVVRAADYGHDPRHRLLVGRASEHAHATGALSGDIRAEQDKLAWADAVVLQFPLWWFGMPAILKGWFDRVFVQGFAFGLTDAAGRTLRYGDGGLTGKRAMIVVTAGARPTGLTARGVHGDLEELLFPIQHGTLWYTGMDVLPPLLVPSADRLPLDVFDDWATRLRLRLRELPTARPIPFRPELGGDYDDDLVLRPHLAPARTGLSVHDRRTPTPHNHNAQHDHNAQDGQGERSEQDGQNAQGDHGAQRAQNGQNGQDDYDGQDDHDGQGERSEPDVHNSQTGQDAQREQDGKDAQGGQSAENGLDGSAAEVEAALCG